MQTDAKRLRSPCRGRKLVSAPCGRRDAYMPRFTDPYREIAALRAKHGRDKHHVPMPNLTVRRTAPSLTNGFAPVIDNRARTLADRFKNETKHTAQAIADKAARVRIVVSKSAYMYATEADDPKAVHRK